MRCRRRLATLAPGCISRSVLLVLLRADVVVAAWTEIHETIRLEPGAGSAGLVRFERCCPGGPIATAALYSVAVLAGSALPLALDLMMARELFLRRESRRRREGVEELGEFVAGLWEVVLDDARRLIAVKPSVSVVVELPALWQ